MATSKVALPPAVKWAIGLLLGRAMLAVLGFATHFWPFSLVSMSLLLDIGIDLALARGLATRQIWSWGGTLIWGSYLTAEGIIYAVRLLAGNGPLQLGSLSAQAQLLFEGRWPMEVGASAAAVLLLLTRPARRSLRMNQKTEQAEER